MSNKYKYNDSKETQGQQQPGWLLKPRTVTPAPAGAFSTLKMNGASSKVEEGNSFLKDDNPLCIHNLCSPGVCVRACRRACISSLQVPSTMQQLGIALEKHSHLTSLI